MTRNDLLYKIIFAIELALLPIVLFAYVMEAFPLWSTGIFVGGIFGCRVWMEILTNRTDKTHVIINAIGSAITISTLSIFFAAIDLISVALVVFVVIFTILGALLRVVLFGKNVSETIDAVDFCNMLFECALLGVMAFITANVLFTNIALFAVLLTSIVAVAYKLFFVVKYTNTLGNIKLFFTNLFRRK